MTMETSFSSPSSFHSLIRCSFWIYWLSGSPPSSLFIHKWSSFLKSVFPPFFLFSTSVCTCDEGNHGEGGGDVLGLAGSPEKTNYKQWSYRLCLCFRSQIFVIHRFQDGLELKGLHLSGLWDKAGLVIALSKYCGGPKPQTLWYFVHYACI